LSCSSFRIYSINQNTLYVRQLQANSERICLSESIYIHYYPIDLIQPIPVLVYHGQLRKFLCSHSRWSKIQCWFLTSAFFMSQSFQLFHSLSACIDGHRLRSDHNCNSCCILPASTSVSPSVSVPAKKYMDLSVNLPPRIQHISRTVNPLPLGN